MVAFIAIREAVGNVCLNQVITTSQAGIETTKLSVHDCGLKPGQAAYRNLMLTQRRREARMGLASFYDLYTPTLNLYVPIAIKKRIKRYVLTIV